MDYSHHIKCAKLTGGWCVAGHGGYTLHYVNEWGGSSTLTSYTPDLFDAAKAAGLPCIDLLVIEYDVLCRLTMRGPMVGLPGGIDKIVPIAEAHSLSYVSLADWAKLYAQYGGVLFNL